MRILEGREGKGREDTSFLLRLRVWWFSLLLHLLRGFSFWNSSSSAVASSSCSTALLRKPLRLIQRKAKPASVRQLALKRADHESGSRGLWFLNHGHTDWVCQSGSATQLARGDVAHRDRSTTLDHYGTRAIKHYVSLSPLWAGFGPSLIFKQILTFAH